MKTNVGLAAELIDFGYAVKLPLSENLDNAFGFEETHPFSVVGFLKACYVIRRPGFVFVDICIDWQVRMMAMRGW